MTGYICPYANTVDFTGQSMHQITQPFEYSLIVANLHGFIAGHCAWTVDERCPLFDDTRAVFIIDKAIRVRAHRACLYNIVKENKTRKEEALLPHIMRQVYRMELMTDTCTIDQQRLTELMREIKDMRRNTQKDQRLS